MDQLLTRLTHQIEHSIEELRDQLSGGERHRRLEQILAQLWSVLDDLERMRALG